ncbi:MAG TPA: aromatic ring-hydroxylating dioxygenase subunit alpha [Bryobacteraceae bacterium]|jgi:Rieske 2Fe-2S family protein|nr:aromatic ring-hydroxylating dioxygenase subunit alpha [Bryobacteraceae bacterium]
MVLSRRPGWTLEREFYTESSFFEADLDAVFRRSWLCAGHVSRIRESGDYFLFEAAGESLIVVRGRDGRVHALWNSCRHRGSRVCSLPSGNAKRLICPYHQWAYDTDGSLLKARLMPDDFDRSQFGLRPAHVRVLEGLIFVCLSGDAPDFDEFARLVGPQLQLQRLERARICRSRQYEVRANWKLVLENSRECYHCGVGHPQYCRAVGFAAGIDSPKLAEEDASVARERLAGLAARGMEANPVPFRGDAWFHCRRFFLRPGFASETMDGAPAAPLLAALPGEELGVLAVVTLPGLLLEACSDYAMLMRFMPLSASATHVEIDWLVSENAVEGVDLDSSRVEEFWRLTAEQDWRLCEENHLGVDSSGYRPGPYAPGERGVEQFVRWYLNRMNENERLRGGGSAT